VFHLKDCWWTRWSGGGEERTTRWRC